jgi:hypothetical protein
LKHIKYISYILLVTQNIGIHCDELTNGLETFYSTRTNKKFYIITVIYDTESVFTGT